LIIKNVILSNIFVCKSLNTYETVRKKIKRGFLTTLLLLTLFIFTTTFLQAGGTEIEVSETDGGDFQLIAFFDLRDRETFVQVTNTDSAHGSATVHVQIFTVNDLCNENNFFDAYTVNDTHVYDLRNIVTNDGNPSGVVLAENAYGIVVVTCQIKDLNALTSMIGNVRIKDINGYEYRTNMQGVGINQVDPATQFQIYTFNYNTKSGVSLSDVVGLALNNLGSEEVSASADIYSAFDVDIINENEVIFSCRNVLFACTDQNNPRLEEIFANSGDANVASFEYGINNTIPHSKGGELLCRGNTISDGLVRLDLISGSAAEVFLYVGLNNGNGRGSFDSVWLQTYLIMTPPQQTG